MDLLDLPAQDAEAPARPDSWAFARRMFPDSDIVRVIDRSVGKQYFVQIPRPRKNADLHPEYAMLAADGTTYITPGPAGATKYEKDRERLRIIAEADAAWPVTLV